MNKNDLIKLAGANSINYREVENEEMNYDIYFWCLILGWC